MYKKGWWRTIRVFFNGVHQKIPALQTDDGCVLSNSMDKANFLNKMFSSYSELNAGNRVPPNLDFRTNARLQEIILSESEVLDILKTRIKLLVRMK